DAATSGGRPHAGRRNKKPRPRIHTHDGATLTGAGCPPGASLNIYGYLGSLSGVKPVGRFRPGILGAVAAAPPRPSGAAGRERGRATADRSEDIFCLALIGPPGRCVRESRRATSPGVPPLGHAGGLGDGAAGAAADPKGGGLSFR